MHNVDDCLRKKSQAALFNTNDVEQCRETVNANYILQLAIKSMVIYLNYVILLRVTLRIQD